MTMRLWLTAAAALCALCADEAGAEVRVLPISPGAICIFPAASGDEPGGGRTLSERGGEQLRNA